MVWLAGIVVLVVTFLASRWFVARCLEGPEGRW